MIESALVSLALTDADLLAAIGRRLVPVIESQGKALPYIVYQRISSQHVHSYAGVTGMASARMQFDVYADTYKQTVDIAELLRLALAGFSGTVTSVEIKGIFHESTHDFTLAPQHAKERPVYRRSMDFEVWYAEAIPA